MKSITCLLVEGGFANEAVDLLGSASASRTLSFGKVVTVRVSYRHNINRLTDVSHGRRHDLTKLLTSVHDT